MKTVQDKNLLEMPIGVFDSGMGGLTVMREIMRQIPNEKVIYFGDTARVPYGSKSKETVTRFSRQIVRFYRANRSRQLLSPAIRRAPMRWMIWKRKSIFQSSAW